ncbi:palmitoyl-protein thioesterase ABHD10, mitochondrial-like isoform X2 [Hemitrygon akajei]|uniref:palmitoyl-protein thioesterase ABHD10, mitochondrial-like isoform X2 n=1 Tax=Hemitrygon akajei TaxID=2704970 RepID=UPI003BF94B89
MSSMQFLTRLSLPRLAYYRIAAKNPGVVFLSGFKSNMNGEKALALEAFCDSAGYSFIRFDYTGCGSSEGNSEDCLLGDWKNDVLTVLDNLTTGPQLKKEAEVMGQYNMPSRYSVTGYHTIKYDFVKEAEGHCLLQGSIPISCPVRLLHGMKDDIVPWQNSITVAEQLTSDDVDVIFRKNGDHRLSQPDDLKLLVAVVDDLMQKLTKKDLK